MQDPKNRHLGTIAQICRALSSQLPHISTIGKNTLSSNISSTCPHNMVNFGPLTAEIVSLVWGTPANFNGFRVLAGLLHGTPELGVSQKPNFAGLNRGRRLYSTGRPSRRALAYIPSFYLFHFRCLVTFSHLCSHSSTCIVAVLYLVLYRLAC